MDNAREAWQKTLSQRVLKWPDEEVIRFLTAMYGVDISNLNLLDLACGNGRHIMWLAKEGASVTGVDISAELLSIVKKRLENEGLSARLICSDITSMPLEDESFDAIVCDSFQVIPDMRSALVESFRVLKTNGYLWSVFRNRDDWMYGLGEQVGETGFVLDERAGSYKGMLYHFLSKEEVTKLFKSVGFELSNIESKTLIRNNLSQRHSWWIIWAKKT
jgi:ubiquinone/menaquinone biosynthesis C-methylase UbiE